MKLKPAETFFPDFEIAVKKKIHTLLLCNCWEIYMNNRSVYFRRKSHYQYHTHFKWEMSAYNSKMSILK